MVSDERPVVLVTGSDSFTGRHVMPRLEKAGFRAVGVVKNSEPGSNELQCDLTDFHEVSSSVNAVRPQYVLHLAGVSHVAHEERRDFYDVNLIGTLNLLRAVSSAKVNPRKVVLASSANVYGNAVVDPITEETAASPVSDYAVSKLAMEHMARLWFERLPVIITRPFNYTGVGQSTAFLLPKIVDHYRRKAHAIELGNINVTRDFSDVRMVAECYVRLLNCQGSGNVVNICSGTGTSIAEVLRSMELISGHRLEVRVNRALVRSHEIGRLVGSSKRLEQLIGALPRISLTDTLRWMFEEQSLTQGAA